MSKFELSISADYVSHWGVTEATREFFQNALDEQVANPENKMFFDYSEDEETLRIGNRNSVLTAQTLLFGKTTKANDSSTIGQFGEGYKIATVVFLRNNKQVTFYNYATNEIWRTKLVKSRKYKGELVPTFYTEKVPFWDHVSEYSLIIEITGITPDEFQLIKSSNLHLQNLDESSINRTKYGSILTSADQKGRVYVSGLYVCDKSDLEYGYDYDPRFIKLDRDRRMVSDFDVEYESSRIWGAYSEISYGSGFLSSRDAKYINTFLPDSNRKRIALEFLQKHGSRAVPVLNQDELANVLKLGLVPVIVAASEKSIILEYTEYYKSVSANNKSLYERLAKVIEDISDRLEPDEVSELLDILSKSENLLK